MVRGASGCYVDYKRGPRSQLRVVGAPDLCEGGGSSRLLRRSGGPMGLGGWNEK